MRSIVESTYDFENWMRERTDICEELLLKKHHMMAAEPLLFLQATFYRWVEQWPVMCRALSQRDEDVVLALGDLHIENFGVWLDSQRRLVWGVNDFDEPCELPFTSDLVRLAASVLLASAAAKLNVAADLICAKLLEGYETGLRIAEPILAVANPLLIKLTRDTTTHRDKFWREKLDPNDNRRVHGIDLQNGLEHLFRASFKPTARPWFLEQLSPSGVGSLGRRRFSAVAIVAPPRLYEAREAKALVPSALYWLRGQTQMPSQAAALLQHAIRLPDPYFRVSDHWLIRQLMPDIGRIEMPEHPNDKRLGLAPSLLRLMGRETANIHLGSRTQQNLKKLLNQLGRDRRWFSTATERMVASTRKDHAEWAAHFRDSAEAKPKRKQKREQDAPRRLRSTAAPVFISYAREDQSKARAIERLLRQYGIPIWFDHDALKPGQRWHNEITTAIRSCRIFVFCLSATAVQKRGFVQVELHEALEVLKTFPEDKVFVIPVRLEKCRVPLSLEGYHYLDYFAADGPSKLVEAVRTNVLD